MKTTLPDNIPRKYQDQIGRIRDVIVKHFGGRVDKIILYGSFARGDWVSDLPNGYFSDFDILIVTVSDKTGNGKAGERLKSSIDNWLENNLPPISKYRIHEPSIVVEAPGHVNKQLRRGRYFFSDIKEQGILLHDGGKIVLEEKSDLDPAEIKEMMIEDYEHWFPKGNVFLYNAKHSLERNELTDSAFQLHQATEHLLGCALLVLGGYKPTGHSIRKLYGVLCSQSNNFLPIFPRNTKTQRQSLDKLEKAYIGARYSKNYEITKEQLEYLIERVEMLKDLVDEICGDIF